MNPKKSIRVLIVDDSSVARRIISELLRKSPRIEVIGEAADAYEARDQIIKKSPDVVTLDLEMPKMDGLSFLRILMAQRPTPVVVLSALTRKGSQTALSALTAGAVEVMGKPSGGASQVAVARELIHKVEIASRVQVKRVEENASPTQPPIPRESSEIDHSEFDPRQLILLGASTGGTVALKSVLTKLPHALPGICVVQHIPAKFSTAFAESLNHLCPHVVKEAENDDVVLPGHIFVAPGGYHIKLVWRRDAYVIRLNQDEPVWHQRPAVDVMFDSIAKNGADTVVAGVLTGMGRDGAAGLKTLRDAGARTFSQDEESCVVYGMPKAAWESGGSERQVPLDRIPAAIVERVRELTGKATPTIA